MQELNERPKKQRRDGGTRCAAWGCDKSKLKDGIGVFEFPAREKSPERFDFWCKAVGRTRQDFKFVKGTSRLCGDHFGRDQIENWMQIRVTLEEKGPEAAGKIKWRLVPKARPSLDLFPKWSPRGPPRLTTGSASDGGATPRRPPTSRPWAVKKDRRKKHFDDTQRELNHPERPLKGDAVPNNFQHTKRVLGRPRSKRRIGAVSSQFFNELDHSYAIRSGFDSGTTKVKRGKIVPGVGEEKLSRFEGVNADQDQHSSRILKSSRSVDSSMVYIDVAKDDTDDENIIKGDAACVGHVQEELIKDDICQEYKTQEDNTCAGYAEEKLINYEICKEFIKTEDQDTQELDQDQQNPLICGGYAEEKPIKFETCEEFIKTEVWDDQELGRDQQTPLAFENQYKSEDTGIKIKQEPD